MTLARTRRMAFVIVNLLAGGATAAPSPRAPRPPDPLDESFRSDQWS